MKKKYGNGGTGGNGNNGMPMNPNKAHKRQMAAHAAAKKQMHKRPPMGD